VRDSARQRGGGEVEGGGWGQRAIPARRLLLADKARDAAIKVRNSPFHAVKKTVRARTRIKSNIIRHKNIPCARARADGMPRPGSPAERGKANKKCSLLQ